MPTPAHLRFDVTAADTAVALGSGDVPVLATPRLLAWLEAATCAAASGAGAVGAGRTSVGTRIAVEHLLATPVGGHLDVTAGLVHADGRLLRFAVAATDGGGRLVATGEITRVVVDRDRFLARVPAAATANRPGPAGSVAPEELGAAGVGAQPRGEGGDGDQDDEEEDESHRSHPTMG